MWKQLLNEEKREKMSRKLLLLGTASMTTSCALCVHNILQGKKLRSEFCISLNSKFPLFCRLMSAIRLVRS